jgi:F0F1-type ATP synthase assembly protein I
VSHTSGVFSPNHTNGRISAAVARPSSTGPSGAELAGLGMALAAAVVVPMVLGYLVDGALRTSPLFLFVGLAVGIIAAVALVYTRYVTRYM